MNYTLLKWWISKKRFDRELNSPRNTRRSEYTGSWVSDRLIKIYGRPSKTESIRAHELTARQSIAPVSLTILLYILWGFSGGCGEVLNKRFQEALDLTKAMSAALQVAFFGAYLIGATTYGAWFVRKLGYRWTFVIGLCIYAVGSAAFWPSGHYRCFPAFCVSAFIMGSGIATLEVAAIPYVTVCGPTKYAELRLCIAQGFNSASGVVALVMCSFVILDSSNAAAFRNHSLLPIQNLHACISGASFLLALLFALVRLPEVTDSEILHATTQNTTQATWTQQPLRRQPTLWLGVLAAFTFSGSQVAVAAFFLNYLADTNPSLSPQSAAHYLAGAQSLFACGRFAASALMRTVKPRHILAVALTLVLAFLATASAVTGAAAIAVLYLEFLAKSCIFPTILALSLRGLGEHTTRGAGFLIASICGAVVFSPALGAAADRYGTRRAMLVPLLGTAVAGIFPIWVNGFRASVIDAVSHGPGHEGGHERRAGVEEGGEGPTAVQMVQTPKFPARNDWDLPPGVLVEEGGWRDIIWGERDERDGSCGRTESEQESEVKRDSV